MYIRGLGARPSRTGNRAGPPRAPHPAPRPPSPLPVCPLLPPSSRLETNVAMCNGYKCTVILLVQYLLDFYLFMMYIYFPTSPPLPRAPSCLTSPPLPPYISGCDSTLTGGSRLRGGTTSVRDFGSLIKADFKHRLLRAGPGGGWWLLAAGRPLGAHSPRCPHCSRPHPTQFPAPLSSPAPQPGAH